MLADPRSEALVNNFAEQWLYLRNCRRRHRTAFISRTSTMNCGSFQRETELFWESIVREDRSVLELINADYTFLNERLAKHYGSRTCTEADFRRVSVPPAADGGGLLGQGSLLTVTSYATRTSP